MNNQDLAHKKFLQSVAYVMDESDPSKETQWLTTPKIAVSLFGNNTYLSEIAKLRRALIKLSSLGAVERAESPFTQGYVWKLVDVAKVPGF